MDFDKFLWKGGARPGMNGLDFGGNPDQNPGSKSESVSSDF